MLHSGMEKIHITQQAPATEKLQHNLEVYA